MCKETDAKPRGREGHARGEGRTRVILQARGGIFGGLNRRKGRGDFV